MTYYGIYKITNLTNGKMYIGKHKTSNIDDGYMGSGIVLNQAIKKYGVENFRKEWLMFCEDEDEMNYMERVFVDQTWVDRSDTYNLKIGGEGGSCKGTNKGNTVWKGRHHTEITKQKLSDARKGEDNPMYGKHHTANVRNRISAAFKGKSLSSAHKRKISLAHKGKKLSDMHKAKLSIIHKGRHWYNDGNKSVMAYECPEGFKQGRI